MTFLAKEQLKLRDTILVQVSPHEFMQGVMQASQKRFTIDNPGDPVEFWSWLLTSLHMDLTGGKRKKASVISRCFQVLLPPPDPNPAILNTALRACPKHNRLHRSHSAAFRFLNILTYPRPLPRETPPSTVPRSPIQVDEVWQCERWVLQGELEITTEGGSGRTALQAGGDGQPRVERVPFLMLGLDLPPAPLYKDKDKKDIIPQVSLHANAIKHPPHACPGSILRFRPAQSGNEMT